MQKNYIFLLLLLILTNNCAKNKITSQDLQETKKEELLDINEVLKKQTKDMSFEEAVLTKEYYEKNNDPDMVIKAAERIIAIGSDQEVSAKATLDLAKLYLDKASFEKAQKYASDYQIMYPGTDQSKEASFIGIKAHFLASLEPDRDQTNTKKALELALEYEKNYSDDTEYLQNIKDMIKSSYKKLLDHEIAIINLYLSRYDYFKSYSALKSAQKRMEYIKNKLLPNLPEQQESIKSLEDTISNLLKTEKPEIKTEEKNTEILSKNDETKN